MMPLAAQQRSIWSDSVSDSGAGSLEVLDVAGGSGWPAIPMAKAFPAAHITCTGLPSLLRALGIFQLCRSKPHPYRGHSCLIR